MQGALATRVFPQLSAHTKFTPKDDKFYLYTFPFSHYCIKARWALDLSSDANARNYQEIRACVVRFMVES